MSEPTRHELKQFLCNHCNKPDAELFGMMVSHDEGRWVSYDDYATLKAEIERMTLLQSETLAERNKAEAENEKWRNLTRYWSDKYKDENASLHRARKATKEAYAQVERLTKAGDATLEYLLDYVKPTDGYLTYLDCRANWNAAKEGKTDA